MNNAHLVRVQGCREATTWNNTAAPRPPRWVEGPSSVWESECDVEPGMWMLTVCRAEPHNGDRLGCLTGVSTQAASPPRQAFGDGQSTWWQWLWATTALVVKGLAVTHQRGWGRPSQRGRGLYKTSVVPVQKPCWLKGGATDLLLTLLLRLGALAAVSLRSQVQFLQGF